MPHVQRHKKRKKKPNRSQPLSITEPQALLEHRELVALRIAGAAKPGARRDTLLNERFEKLDESLREVQEAEADVVSKAPCDPRKDRRRKAALAREIRRINNLPGNLERLDAIRDFLMQHG